MAEQQRWFADNPDTENQDLALASDTEAYGGHVGKARELNRRARTPPCREDSKETAADMAGDRCSREAAYGNLRKPGKRRHRL